MALHSPMAKMVAVTRSNFLALVGMLSTLVGMLLSMVNRSTEMEHDGRGNLRTLDITISKLYIKLSKGPYL